MVVDHTVVSKTLQGGISYFGTTGEESKTKVIEMDGEKPMIKNEKKEKRKPS